MRRHEDKKIRKKNNQYTTDLNDENELRLPAMLGK